MGLDTSHDCWHGPYSSFAEWRAVIAEAAGRMIINVLEDGRGNVATSGEGIQSRAHVLVAVPRGRRLDVRDRRERGVSVDDEVLDILTQQAAFAADNAAIQAAKTRVYLTPHDLTTRELRAGLRNLLANGLIAVPERAELDAIFEAGVTLT